MSLLPLLRKYAAGLSMSALLVTQFAVLAWYCPVQAGLEAPAATFKIVSSSDLLIQSCNKKTLI